MISHEQLEQISQLAGAGVISTDMVNDLRQSFPDIHFTYCMDDDVLGVEPVAEYDSFNLYLIDSRNHCLAFTRDMDVATGVVVAEKEDDE
ncbi:MAG: DUF6129 family protein [Chromatiales bacterium]